MDILVIGGSYFIGKAIVANLLKNKCNVFVLNRGSKEIPDTTQILADRNKEYELGKALSKYEYFDYVIDTSCYTLDQCKASYEVLKNKYKHWIFLSSAAVYVGDGCIPFDESSKTGKSSQWGNYGLDKLCAEQFLLEQRNDNYLTIVRPPYVYGPENYLDREKFIWARLKIRRPILIPGNGQTLVQFIHAEDLSYFMFSIIENKQKAKKEIYNIASECAVTFNSWVRLLADIAKMSLDIVYVPYNNLDIKVRDFFPFRDYPLVLNTNKARKDLKWSEYFGLKVGFQNTYDHWDGDTAINTDKEELIINTLIK